MHENIKGGISPHSTPLTQPSAYWQAFNRICQFVISRLAKFPAKYQWETIWTHREVLRTGDVFNRRQRIVKDVVSARKIISAYIATLKKIHGDGQLLLPIDYISCFALHNSMTKTEICGLYSYIIFLSPMKNIPRIVNSNDSLVEASWNVTAHAQKPDFVFRRNGRVHLNRRGRQFSRLLAAEVCASAVVMLDTPCSEVVWRVLATHCICQFPLHFSSRASPCAITFQPGSK